ncbi:putative disease resistance protein [Senna tora]|uniref:Putative disease resistance protein n=1 Tax=Senna tora TaxID=362788 RepID=A0A834XE90_9FABA|nr:putative disease resistance protein [Senna tora]
MAAEMGTAVATEVAKPLVIRAMKEASYLCCFKCYVEDYEQEKSRLEATRDSVLEDVKEARQRNETLIDKEAEHWLKEANDLIIQEDTKTKKKWFLGLCTNCIWQYEQGKKLANKTKKIPSLIEGKKNLVRVARSAGPPGMVYHSSSDFIHFKSREAKSEQLKEALGNENNHIIGLQGMGGSGKTTMAKQVGKVVEESKLFDKVIFTVVSNPPNVEKVQRDIARHLGLPLAEGKETEEYAESLWCRISNGGQKLLIILDDVWEKELDLKAIGIPLGHHDKFRCSVFLTTRDLKVCKEIGCQKTIQLEVLPNKEALDLFLFHAAKCGVNSSSDFKELALDIVKGCGGLPVAIEAIAKALNYEPLEVWKTTSTALHKFDPILYDDDDGDMKKAYNCLKLSYDNLKNEKAQKLFLLCSLFPEDDEMLVEFLSRIAIGLGLCGEVDEYNKARRQVLAVKRKLIDSSLLLEDEEGNVKMHDLVHEVAIKIANKEIQVVRDSNTILKENVRFSFWIDGFPHRFDGSKLEVLITNFVKFPNALFEGMTKLRVLVIYSMYGDFPGSAWVKSIQSSLNIRTLHITNLKLEDISSMGNLQSLETLELFRCSIVEFPNEITKLESLRLLGLTCCNIERNNPFKVIERCSRLEELYYRKNRDIFEKELEDKEVGDIGVPRTLQMYEIIGEKIKKFFFPTREDTSLLRRFKPRYLQNIFSKAAFKFFAAKAEILELDGFYGTGWTNLIPDIALIEDGGMNDLIELSLESFPEMECLINTENIASEVTIFSKLVKLGLSTMGVKELCCGPFPSGFLMKLEMLYLEECSNLEGTLFKGKLDLGQLKCIILENCSMSSLFHPSAAQSLKQLEELEIRECHELKYIIDDEGLGEDIVEDDPVDSNEMSHDSMFSKLKFVHVFGCHKLEFIFPIRIVEDLSLLEEVNIDFCGKLKHIFGQHLDEDEDEGVSFQKEKEIKLQSLKEMRICHAPKFVNIFPAEYCCHPMSPVMKKLSTTKDDLKTTDPSLSCPFSWAPICCFMHNSTATSIDNPSVSEEILTNCTGLQELKTQVFNPAKCFLRPPLDPRNLREIIMTQCSNFTWLFTLSIASSMPLLEELQVGECRGLKQIFTIDRADDDHKKYSSIFPKLKVVGVWDCDLLKSLFPASHFVNLDLLEVLRISGTPKLRYVLGKSDCDDNLSHQSQLAQESHQDVPNMLGFIKGIDDLFAFTGKEFMCFHEIQGTTNCLLRLPLNPLHLREMSINFCSNWTSLFTLSIASSMSLLESLEVTECHGLKHIVKHEGDNGHDHMNYSSIFPNLKRISVCDCSILEYIFPASHCRSFNHLESVKIFGVDKLRYMFGKCCCEDNLPHHNQNIEIHLPALKVLLFDYVPNMVSIGTQSCHFTALCLKRVESPLSLVGVFQGIDFQKVPYLVNNCPNILPTYSPKMDYDDDGQSHQEIVEYNENPASKTNSQLQDGPKAQAALSKKKLSPSQSKKEVVEKEPAIQMKNNNTPNLTKSTKGTTNRIAAMETPSSSSDISTTIPQQIPSLIIKETEDSSVHEGPKLEKAITPSEIIESEPSNASSIPFVIPLQNESPKDKLFGNEAKNKTVIIDQQAEAETRPDIYSNNSQNNNEVSSGEGPSSKKYFKVTSSTHSEPKVSSPGPLTSTEEFHEKESKGDEEVLGESKRLDNTQEMKGTESNPIVTSLEDTSGFALDQIMVNEAETYTDEKIKVDHRNPQQFEDDDLIRLFQTIEEGADIGIHKPYVSKITALEDDNKVAMAFSDVETLLKMGVNEIAKSEEDRIRLENALEFLSTHYSRDGAPSHMLKDKVDSMRQEISSILSSFKQASARLSAIDTFTELEEKEKSINEELPQRKEAAITLISEICETKKTIDEAQKKEVELKEQITRLQAELKRKEKEIRDCEIKLSSLEEQKKKSVWDTIGFLEECEAVKKERSQIVEEKMKARQELEKVEFKWSSCEAKWWKTILLQAIYVKKKL